MGTIRTGITTRTNPKSGEEKLYATIVGYGNIGNNALVQSMVENSNIARSCAVAAVDAFVNTVKNFVLNGHSVKIPNLGTFSLTIRAKMQESADDVTPTTFKSAHIRFTPESQIKSSVKSIKFSGILVDDDTKTEAVLKTPQQTKYNNLETT